ncbi:4-hydroxy-tetrahydrodipicolinate synthase [bacterium]|nr:4-hydroxy-tetrahydrodipicolinate synthase [bacterium]
MFAPFGNIVTAMVTPFDVEGKVADDLVEGLAKRLVKTGTDTILIGGTTGESPTLQESELLSLIDTVRANVPDGTKIMVGTGTNSTRTSLELSKKVAGKRVDGLLLVNPYYNKPTQDGLEAHFRAIAESVDTPVVLYNIPGRTGVNCNPETIAKLSEITNVVAVKEASGSVEAVAKIRSMTSLDKFAIYSGDDALTLPMLSVGAAGVISVASHLVGAKISEMIKSFFKGDIEKSRDIHVSLIPLFEALFCSTNPIPIKYALNRIGTPVGGHRLPLTPLSDGGRTIVDAALKQAGLVQ